MRRTTAPTSASPARYLTVEHRANSTRVHPPADALVSGERPIRFLQKPRKSLHLVGESGPGKGCFGGHSPCPESGTRPRGEALGPESESGHFAMNIRDGPKVALGHALEECGRSPRRRSSMLRMTTFVLASLLALASAPRADAAKTSTAGGFKDVVTNSAIGMCAAANHKGAPILGQIKIRKSGGR